MRGGQRLGKAAERGQLLGGGFLALKVAQHHHAQVVRVVLAHVRTLIGIATAFDHPSGAVDDVVVADVRPAAVAGVDLADLLDTVKRRGCVGEGHRLPPLVVDGDLPHTVHGPHVARRQAVPCPAPAGQHRHAADAFGGRGCCANRGGAHFWQGGAAGGRGLGAAGPQRLHARHRLALTGGPAHAARGGEGESRKHHVSAGQGHGQSGAPGRGRVLGTRAGDERPAGVFTPTGSEKIGSPARAGRANRDGQLYRTAAPRSVTFWPRHRLGFGPREIASG